MAGMNPGRQSSHATGSSGAKVAPRRLRALVAIGGLSLAAPFRKCRPRRLPPPPSTAGLRPISMPTISRLEFLDRTSAHEAGRPKGPGGRGSNAGPP